jgi:hypothetical protein
MKFTCKPLKKWTILKLASAAFLVERTLGGVIAGLEPQGKARLPIAVNEFNIFHS